MWKKIHVELEFIRLEFHHFKFFFLTVFWVLTQCSWLCSKSDSCSMDLPPWPSRTLSMKSPTSESTWASATIRAAPRSRCRRCCYKQRRVTSRVGERSLRFFLCSSSLFVIKSFLCSSLSNRSFCSSSGLMFFKYQNRRPQISLTQERRRQRRRSSRWRFFFFGSLVWWIFVVWWCFSSLGLLINSLFDDVFSFLGSLFGIFFRTSSSKSCVKNVFEENRVLETRF